MPSVRTNAIRVGAFVVVGVVLAVIVLIYFGASDLLARKQVYVTYFERSVQGLNIDSPVKFRGVTVGKVAGMAIAPDGQLIEVRMSLEPEFPVHDSLGVQMNITGITGLRYLEMDFASPEELDTAPELAFEPPHPVIRSVPGGFEEIETALKSVYERLMKIDTEGISFEAKEFLRTGTKMMTAADSIINQPEMTAWVDKLNRSLGDLEGMIAQLKAERMPSRLDSTLSELHLAAVEARAGAQRLNRGLGTLEDDIERLHVSTRADTLFTNINQAFRTTSELVGQSQYSVSQVVARLSLTVQELNETLERMNSLMLSLEDYPSRVLYAAPPEREK
ncbi:MAG: hypothetical protein MAG453_00768 [Calditrichaeota bacterium]|nr:hypothetical protein [Calditrichota bacterium]